MNLKIGDKAPHFALKDTEFKDVSLSDFKGENLVVFFFPMAFSGMCTQEMCTIRDDKAAFGNLDASLVAISVDSPFTLAKFKNENGLNFPVLSDFNKDVSLSYNALYEHFVHGLKGVSKRAAFVVDKKGIVQYAEVLENAGNLPNFEAIKETLNKIA